MELDSCNTLPEIINGYLSREGRVELPKMASDSTGGKEKSSSLLLSAETSKSNAISPWSARILKNSKTKAHQRAEPGVGNAEEKNQPYTTNDTKDHANAENYTTPTTKGADGTANLQTHVVEIDSQEEEEFVDFRVDDYGELDSHYHSLAIHSLSESAPAIETQTPTEPRLSPLPMSSAEDESFLCTPPFVLSLPQDVSCNQKTDERRNKASVDDSQRNKDKRKDLDGKINEKDSSIEEGDEETGITGKKQRMEREKPRKKSKAVGEPRKKKGKMPTKNFELHEDGSSGKVSSTSTSEKDKQQRERQTQKEATVRKKKGQEKEILDHDARESEEGEGTYEGTEEEEEEETETEIYKTPQQTKSQRTTLTIYNGKNTPKPDFDKFSPWLLKVNPTHTYTTQTLTKLRSS